MFHVKNLDVCRAALTSFYSISSVTIVTENCHMTIMSSE